MNNLVCESFINYCDELLIPAEEGWLQRLFAKSSSKKDVDSEKTGYPIDFKVVGVSDYFTVFLFLYWAGSHDWSEVFDYRCR